MKLSFKNILPILLIFTLLILFAGCSLTPSTYTVTYNGNGNTSGVVPTDANLYEQGALVTVLGKGNLVKISYSFVGWNTAANGSGISQAAGSTFNMGTTNVTLYAQWTTNTYTVTYDGNGNTTGTVPIDPSSPYESGATVTVLGNTGDLTRINDWGASYYFTGWNTKADGSGTDQAEGSTFIMGGSPVTLYAQWAHYVLRDTGPAGGYIFYCKGGYSHGWRYLEAAPSDQSAIAPWGCYGTLIPGADGTAVGTGEQNTIDIEAGCTTPGTAADICANLDLGGYSDWFLPSKDELNLMYENLKVFGVGGFAVYYYWSSSEYLASIAWLQYFGNGHQYYNAKDDTYRVRAVRAF